MIWALLLFFFTDNFFFKLPNFYILYLTQNLKIEQNLAVRSENFLLEKA